jgi:hypothetical protein
LDLEQLRVDRIVPEMQDSDRLFLLRHAANRGLQAFASRFDQPVVYTIATRKAESLCATVHTDLLPMWAELLCF